MRSISNSALGGEYGVDIETLFKCVPPFSKLKDGHGFLGVLLRDTKEDKLQCHICGIWSRFLGLHIKKHKLNSEEYRRRFELPVTFPLCAKAISARHSELSSTEKQLAILRRNRKNGCYKKKKKNMSRVMRYAKSNAAHKNKHGACDEQIEQRYLTVCDIVGKEASQRDLAKHDDSLRGLIYRRFGTINKMRVHYAMQSNPRVAPHGRIKMIAALRAYADKNGHHPRPKHFVRSVDGAPTAQAIRNEFGSWRRALLAAGFIPELRNTYSSSQEAFKKGG